MTRVLGKKVRLPLSPCPRCGHELDAASGFGQTARPAPGDITVCINCSHVMAFDRKLKLRELTKDEARAVAKDYKVTFARLAIKKMNAERRS